MIDCPMAFTDSQRVVIEAYFENANKAISKFTSVVKAPEEIKARLVLVYYTQVLAPKYYQILLDEYYPPTSLKSFANQINYFRNQLSAINSICTNYVAYSHSIFQDIFDTRLMSVGQVSLDIDSRKELVSNYFKAQIEAFLNDHQFYPVCLSVPPEAYGQKYARIIARANQLLTEHLSDNLATECNEPSASDNSSVANFTPYACVNNGSPLSNKNDRTTVEPTYLRASYPKSVGLRK